MTSKQSSSDTPADPLIDSALSIDDVIDAGVSLSELAFDDGVLYWLESIPADDGRITIKSRTPDGKIMDLTPDWNVRNHIHSYGGGSYDIRDGWLVWVDHASQAIWLRDPNAMTRKLYQDDGLYGGLQIYPDLELIFAIRQSADDEDQIIALGFDGKLEILVSGSDFYANVTLGLVNKQYWLSWTQWNQPAMAWDSSLLLAANLTFSDKNDLDQPTISLSEPQLIAGVADGTLDGVSIQHPKWFNETLYFISDASGFFNFWQWYPGIQAQAIHIAPYDFDNVQWSVDNRAFAVVDGKIKTWFREDGIGYLANLNNAGYQRLSPVADVNSIANRYALISRSTAPQAIVDIDSQTVIYQPQLLVDETRVCVARSITFDGPAGKVQAWYYPPIDKNPKPALIVTAHGGPTLFSDNGYNPKIQFWTSRGYAVLDVNYSGSGGFGRNYRNRLRNNWGLLDAKDVIAATNAVIDAGLVDRRRIAISGSSAGGLTVLVALASSDLFAAGISRYGVTDLTGLVGGPKLEARYLDSLVGSWPEHRKRYEQRSPVNRAAQINAAMLFLQGSDDPIVVPQQAKMMAEALTNKGVANQLIIFDNESHGFRSKEAKYRSYQAEEEFLVKYLMTDQL